MTQGIGGGRRPSARVERGPGWLRVRPSRPRAVLWCAITLGVAALGLVSLAEPRPEEYPRWMSGLAVGFTILAAMLMAWLTVTRQDLLTVSAAGIHSPLTWGRYHGRTIPWAEIDFVRVAHAGHPVGVAVLAVSVRRPDDPSRPGRDVISITGLVLPVRPEYLVPEVVALAAGYTGGRIGGPRGSGPCPGPPPHPWWPSS